MQKAKFLRHIKMQKAKFLKKIQVCAIPGQLPVNYRPMTQYVSGPLYINTFVAVKLTSPITFLSPPVWKRRVV